MQFNSLMKCSLLFDWFGCQINSSFQPFRYFSKARQPLYRSIRPPLWYDVHDHLLHCFFLCSMFWEVPVFCRNGYRIAHKKVTNRWYCWLRRRCHGKIMLSFTDGLKLIGPQLFCYYFFVLLKGEYLTEFWNCWTYHENFLFWIASHVQRISLMDGNKWLSKLVRMISKQLFLNSLTGILRRQQFSRFWSLVEKLVYRHIDREIIGFSSIADETWDDASY